MSSAAVAQREVALRLARRKAGARLFPSSASNSRSLGESLTTRMFRGGGNRTMFATTTPSVSSRSSVHMFNSFSDGGGGLHYFGAILQPARSPTTAAPRSYVDPRRSSTSSWRLMKVVRGLNCSSGNSSNARQQCFQVSRRRFASGPTVVFNYEKDGQMIGPCETKPQHQSLLDVAQDYDIEIEGACGGNAACSTCHVYLSEEDFAKFKEPDEDELDMLDLAAGLREKQSRLCCQIRLKEVRDLFPSGELVLTVPKESANVFDL
ncbi:unnamed protein product [Amoebophrya sp. A25]|nr:unnamed protein product [Amoebophrya sp. A25]|eukprot:GSA25T00018707001.1